MKSFLAAFEPLQRVHFIPGGSRIPHWNDLGICHGFIGKDEPALQDLYFLKQIHSHLIFDAGESTAHGSSSRPEGDGLFTRKKGLKVAVMTADCVPVLIHGDDVVMAVHAGWRGLFAGIVEAALDKLSHKKSALIGIGPCISQASFEVGPELVAALRDSAFEEDKIPWVLSPGTKDRWHIDLSLVVVFLALKAGIPAENISCMRTCTRVESERWHSYRRDGAGAGRNWSWIAS